ncbi:hypothetical protein [Mucilaginibacter flavus]|uniref:hypothetical protein n=1 Tax=Mucilaginibacter flavus TaxID=931504 RepID=UPI0025B416BB|nr:hypothetical protein [Mucilaginibacter flavus]MDN3581890.1 hypothetical protein [Mucilaginibacter flavus]
MLTITGNADGSTTIGTWKLTDTTLTNSVKNDDGDTVSQAFVIAVTDTILAMAITHKFTVTAEGGSLATYYGRIDSFKL